jgi:hypothetical protein
MLPKWKQHGDYKRSEYTWDEETVSVVTSPAFCHLHIIIVRKSLSGFTPLGVSVKMCIEGS